MSNSAFTVGGGSTGGTVSNIATAGLATGGPITTTGTITVTPATQADMEAGTSNTVAVTPAVIGFEASALKGWIQLDAVNAIIDSYNVSSVTVNAPGDVTINWDAPIQVYDVNGILTGVRDGNFFTSKLQNTGSSSSASRVQTFNGSQVITQAQGLCVALLGQDT